MGSVDTIDLGVIGTGWGGRIRAAAAAASPLVGNVDVAEIRRDRLAEVAEVNAARATVDYAELVADDSIDALIISATPETTHYPMAKEALAAGKHVLLEKPIALTLAEADEHIALAEHADLRFTIRYSQRFSAAAGSSCRRPRWRRRTTSTSCCGVSVRPGPCSCTRRPPTASCERSTKRRTPCGSS
jgi:predicted dehydrogenase